MPGGKTRLTYLITGLQFGGANVGMVRTLSGLDPDEFDVTVASVARTDPDVVPLLSEHVDVVQCGLGSKLAVHRLGPLADVLRETDVLVCSLFHATVVGTVLGTLLRVPTVLVWHHNTEHPNRFRTVGYRLANRLADRLLADSEAVERVLHEEYGVDRARVSRLPIAGVDTEEFTPEAASQRGDGEGTRVATVGRVTEQKGYPELLAAARRLGESFQFHVAGTGSMLAEYRREAPSNVTFHGKVSDEEMAPFYANADVYFQPSRWEGLCMTVVEAMACGRPVVASRVGGIAESVVDGETGLLCPPADVECYCENLRRLAGDPERREAMGRAGRERVIGQYSGEVLGDGFREALERARGRQLTTAQGTSR